MYYSSIATMLEQLKEVFRKRLVNPHAWYCSNTQRVADEAIHERFFPFEVELSRTEHVFNTGFITTHHFGYIRPQANDGGRAQVQTIYTLLLEVIRLDPNDGLEYGRMDTNEPIPHEMYKELFAVDLTLVDNETHKITTRRHVLRDMELSHYHVIDCFLGDNIRLLGEGASEVPIYRERGI